MGSAKMEGIPPHADFANPNPWWPSVKGGRHPQQAVDWVNLPAATTLSLQKMSMRLK